MPGKMNLWASTTSTSSTGNRDWTCLRALNAGDARKSAQDVLNRVRRGRAHYDRIREEQILVQLGDAYFGEGNWENARQTFAKVLDVAESRSTERTLSTLKMGQVADLLPHVL